TRRGLAAWLARAAAVALVTAILLTASRAALVASLANVAFVALSWRQSSALQRASSLAILALLVVGAARLAPAATRARLATLPEEATEGTMHDRTRIWRAGIHLLAKHPLLGVGLDAYPKAAYPELRIHYNAHNTFLSVLVEEGVAGFAIFACLLGALAWFVSLLSASERALWYGTLVVWAVGVSTVAWEHRKPTWLLFALIAAAGARSFQPSGAPVEEGRP
ncbi:MAG TPA: O-antigen ligase family protein, partial [Bryobacteraceae bacterium]|nr:O-antigen ligase family protein [Bryobacteraceae bacterium]